MDSAWPGVLCLARLDMDYCHGLYRDGHCSYWTALWRGPFCRPGCLWDGIYWTGDCWLQLAGLSAGLVCVQLDLMSLARLSWNGLCGLDSARMDTAGIGSYRLCCIWLPLSEWFVGSVVSFALGAVRFCWHAGCSRGCSWVANSLRHFLLQDTDELLV